VTFTGKALPDEGRRTAGAGRRQARRERAAELFGQGRSQAEVACGGCPEFRGTSLAGPAGYQAASSLVGVTSVAVLDEAELEIMFRGVSPQQRQGGDHEPDRPARDPLCQPPVRRVELLNR
jgi:hypothetical protein